MHLPDEQPTTVFAPAPAPAKPRRMWVIATVVAAVVAGVSAIAVALTMPEPSHPTASTGAAPASAPESRHDKKAEAAARLAWAHQYGIDLRTGADLPAVASATPDQRQAAADLLSRTEAATAGWSDLGAAKAAGFDVGAQLAESEKHNRKIAQRLAEVDAHGPGRHPLTMTVVNRTDAKSAQVLDPTAPQALLYAYQGHGAWKVIGARFLADKLYPAAPPTPGGPITRWAYDTFNHLTMRMFFVPGNDLQQAYALKRPAM
ncbi:hypothetical protein ABIA30_000271 [Mycobacterium sp. MAA66]|uniref:hypothetical protein n=1 Tax=Mycobacterium sp. MAA66 TaxID=3156297 RepID=UPI003518CC30